MASFWSRLIGLNNPQVGPEAKAATGPGVVAMTYDTPLASLTRDPQKLARESQAIYHHNGNAYMAESSVSLVAAKVGWHVEDANGNNVTDTHPAVVPLKRPTPPGDKLPLVHRRRLLWQLTLRHGGLCGHTFWYRDRPPGSVPTGFYYINPSRMWDARDAAGNLVGWIMDADRPNGRQPVPFDVDEIMHFVYDPDDGTHGGIGIIEAAWRKLHLAEAADIHAEKSMRAGGRKPGIIMPAAGMSFTDDQYNAIVAELRKVTDSPDAAKKSLIFRAPVDHRDAGVNPQEMQLKELLEMGREDALAMWKVSPSQVGITQSRGLNSGETQKYEEASTWQNAREPRLDMLRETVQEDYLDDFDLTLVLHVPTFDDQAPLYELADKAKVIPITFDERRALVGLPPLGPGNGGDLIYLDKSMVPVGQAEAADEEVSAGGEVKAKLHFEQLHDRLLGAYVPRLAARLERALSEQKAEIAQRIARSAEHLAAKPGDTQKWWDVERESARLEEAIEPVLIDLAREVGRRTSATFFAPAKADPLDLVLEYVRTKGAERIRGINDVTRNEVQAKVAAGIREGLSPSELASTLEPTFGSSRAETIARTESGYALNDGAIGTYRVFDVAEVEVIDGDADDVCARANGSTWTLEEASANPLGHPNCTRDFIPVVKARLPDVAMPEPQSVPGGIHVHLPPVTLPDTVTLPAPQVTVNVPDFPSIPAPQVTVEPAVVNVSPPEVKVHVDPPVIPEVKAALPQEVRVVSMPRRVHQVLRRGKEVTGSVEEDDA